MCMVIQSKVNYILRGKKHMQRSLAAMLLYMLMLEILDFNNSIQELEFAPTKMGKKLT